MRAEGAAGRRRSEAVAGSKSRRLPSSSWLVRGAASKPRLGALGKGGGEAKDNAAQMGGVSDAHQM